jgi:hypothetical protein
MVARLTSVWAAEMAQQLAGERAQVAMLLDMALEKGIIRKAHSIDELAQIMEVPHDEASYDFGFATARAPEHVVTVEVTDERTKTPIKGAPVTLHWSGTPYRNRTDDAGVARISVPKGDYKLYVSAHDYMDFQTTAEVAGDIGFKAELIFRPARPF